MPAPRSAKIALGLAIAGSLLFHGIALFVPDLDLTKEAEEPPPLKAELKLASPKPATAPTPPMLRQAQHERATAERVPPVPPTASPGMQPAAQAGVPRIASPTPVRPEPVEGHAVTAPTPSDWTLSAKGGIRYSVYRGLQGLEVGRATHRWEFAEGRYRIEVMTETSGLAAFFKPIRMDYESRGTLTAAGLRPELFVAKKNGGEGDTATFDWAAGQVTLSRDGRSYPLAEGGQDFASFYYQLVILPQVATGLTMGVALPRKYESYRFEIIGEENVDTPAGTFRTQHVRVQTDSSIDLWLALDKQRLPVKIRHTDKKGDAFEMVAVDFGG